MKKQPIRKRPFGALVEHFIRRLMASEQEQGSTGFGFGMGAVVAIIASPGAFASIFLIDKYSTLLQWLRGYRLNPIRSSPSDEYFFIVLSMTITGLVMVARWNRLFPDRRDFSNLAVLPLPVRSIFSANLLALIGLALLVAVVANGVSAVIFPLFVTISLGTLSALVKVALAHAVSVFAASLFSFFAVFALVGVLMLSVPRRIFRLVSVAARILLLVGLLSEFFVNLSASFLSSGTLPNSSLAWLPSLWFLGNYEAMVGIAKPEMAALAHQAWWCLASFIIISLAAYALCYRRIFLRLPESFDMLAASRAFFRIRLPEPIVQALFRSPFERASIAFSTKVLFRSEPHMMFFGAYLGIGLVVVAQNILTSPPHAVSLSAPLLTAFFLVSGLRFVFEIPAAYEANWIFRTTADAPSPPPPLIARRIILWAALPWQLVLFPLLARYSHAFLPALLETVFNLALTVLLADLLLLRFPKIPFTCLTQLDIRQLLNRMLLSVFGLLVLVPSLAALERWMLASPVRFLPFFCAVGLAYYSLARRRRAAEPELIFEDQPVHFEQLKLG